MNNQEELIESLQNSGYGWISKDDLRRLIILVRAVDMPVIKKAIARIERCSCAGSAGHRENLKVIEQLEQFSV